MENNELKSYSQEELDKAIQEAVSKAVSEATETQTKKHNEEMAQLRIKAKAEQEKAIEKAKEDATLSADELAKKKVEEDIKAKDLELSELRTFKKQAEIEKSLADNQLPAFFKNDSRLLNASDDERAEVIKTIKEEYTQTLPSGSTVDTNVVATGNAGKSKADQELESFRNLGLTK